MLGVLRVLSLACLVGLGACGSEPVPDDPEPRLRALVGSARPGTLNTLQRVEAPAPIGQIGVSADNGMVAVWAGGDYYELESDSFARRALFAEGDEPHGTGDAHVMAPRVESGLWIGADAGLFTFDGYYVTSVDSGVGPVYGVAHRDRGPMKGLWLATEGGLVYQSDKGTVLLGDPEAGGRPAVAVDHWGSAAITTGRVATGRVEVLTKTTRGIAAEDPPLELEGIERVAAGDDTLYAAGEGHLLRWRAAEVPAWTHYQLETPSGDPLDLRALAVDDNTGSAWMRTGAQLIHSEAGGSTAYDVDPIGAGESALVAVDGWGDVWTSSGATLIRLSTIDLSEIVTFSDDLVPWLVTHCSKCHDHDESYEEFVELADEALARVRRGDMPRCAANAPCPPDQRLGVADYALLETWVRQGMAP